MTADREFVGTTGTRHRLDSLFWLLERSGTGRTLCGLDVDLSNPVVQQPVKDCKRCYPKGAET